MRGRPRNSGATSADARAQIVGAASRLFARRGIQSTTMAEIAEASGLGASSLYYWFRSKQQILEVIVEDVNRAPLEAAEALAAATDRSAGARLHELVRRDVEALCALPFDINEVHRLAGEGDEELARYWSDRQRLIRAVERIVEEGVRCGELRAVDARLAALTLLANDEATQNWFRSRRDRHGYDATTIAAFAADLALRGLLR